MSSTILDSCIRNDSTAVPAPVELDGRTLSEGTQITWPLAWKRLGNVEVSRVKEMIDSGGVFFDPDPDLSLLTTSPLRLLVPLDLPEVALSKWF